MPAVRVLALLALMPLFAGCLGDDPDTSETVTPAASGPPLPPVSDALTDPEKANTTVETEATPTLVPISYDGKIDNFVALCEQSTVGTCVNTPTATGASMWSQEIEGRPYAFTVQMTWDANTLATETLGLTALACWETPEGLGCGKVGGGEGTSPLVLDIAETGLPEDTILYLGAYVPSALPQSPVPGAFVAYRLEQEFHLEGIVSVLTSA